MRLDLLAPSVEVGIVTTNLEAMIAFYEGFLGLEFQGEVEFPGGMQRRYSLGKNVLKLVTFESAPPLSAKCSPVAFLFLCSSGTWAPEY